MCAVSSVVHTSNISSWGGGVVKKKISFRVAVNFFHLGRSFSFLVINVCNHGEHYETPCMRKFTGFHGVYYSTDILVGFYTVRYSGFLQTFGNNVMLPY